MEWSSNTAFEVIYWSLHNNFSAIHRTRIYRFISNIRKNWLHPWTLCLLASILELQLAKLSHDPTKRHSFTHSPLPVGRIWFSKVWIISLNLQKAICSIFLVLANNIIRMHILYRTEASKGYLESIVRLYNIVIQI